MDTHGRQLAALSMYHALNDGSLAVFLAALPVMRIAIDLSLIQIGTLLSSGLLATVMMQFVFGYLSDRGHTRWTLVFGIVSLAIIDLMFVKAGNYWHVLMFYLLLRAVAGVYHPVSFSTIFRTAPNRSSAMGIQSAFGDGSLAFAMFSTGFIAESFGWQAPFLLWGLAALAGVITFLSLVDPRHDCAPSPDYSEFSVGRVTKGRITRRYVVVQMSTLFLQCLYLIFSGFMPLFLNVNLHLSPGVSALVVALWLAIGIGSTFNAGRFVAFLGSEKRTLRICFGLTALMLISATALLLRTQYWTAALVLLVLSGVAFFPTFPVVYGVIGTTAPRNRLGLAYATNLSLSLIAGSAFSYLAGYLSSIFTLIVVLPILIAAALATCVTGFLL